MRKESRIRTLNIVVLLGMVLGATAADGRWPLRGGGANDDQADLVVVSVNGSVYSAGTFSGEAAYGSTTLSSAGASRDFVVVKADGAGNILWAKAAGSNGADAVGDIAVDASDNVYVTGEFCGTTGYFGGWQLTGSGGCDVFVAMLDSAGDWQWARQAGGSDADSGQGVAFVPGNPNANPLILASIFIAGHYEGTGTFGSDVLNADGSSDVFVARLDSDGNWIWADDAGSGDDAGEGLIDLVADDQGQLFVSGWFDGDTDIPTETTTELTYEAFGPTNLSDDPAGSGGSPWTPVDDTYYSASTSWFGDNPATVADRRLEMTDGVDLTTATSPTLEFRHRHAFDARVPFTPFLDTFESGSLSGWAISDADRAGAGTHTSQSGRWSMYTRHGSVRVAKAIDTSTLSEVTVGYWVRRGKDSFSEDPDWGEGLKVEYKNSSGSWVQLDHFDGGPPYGEIFTRTHTLGAAACHAGFQLRFRQLGGSGWGWDYWHVDDVSVYAEATSACYDAGVLEYSIDDGSTWYDIEAGGGGIPADSNRITAGDYNEPQNGLESNPLSGRPGWCGNNGLWPSWDGVEVDLSDFVGQTVRFRWRLGAGSAGAGDGWWVDDVAVTDGGATLFAQQIQYYPVNYFVGKLSNTLVDPPDPRWAWVEELPPSIDLEGNEIAHADGFGVAVAGTARDAADFGDGVSTTAAGAFAGRLLDAAIEAQWSWARAATGGTGLGVAVSPYADETIHTYLTGWFEDTITLGSHTLASGGAEDVFVAGLDENGNWRWSSGGDTYDAVDDGVPGNDFDGDGVPGIGGGAGSDWAAAIAGDGVSTLYVAGGFEQTAVFGDDEDIESVGLADAFVGSLDFEGEWFNIQRWVIGEEITPPAGAYLDDITATPDFYVAGSSIQAINDKVYWNGPIAGVQPQAKLYALEPLDELDEQVLEIHWRVSSSLIDPRRIVTIGRIVWPENRCTPTSSGDCYQVHVAGAPVQIEPGDDTLTHISVHLPDWDAGDGAVANGVFTAGQRGYSVVIYAQGDTADPTLFPVDFEVVWSEIYGEAPDFEVKSWAIGSKLTDDFHDQPGRTGYAMYENAFYDGVGTDAAYNRSGRTGTIIPVNRVSSDRDEDADKLMVVVWYRKNSKGVYWGEKPVHYDCQWPPVPEKIIIASEEGGETLGQQPLDPLLYPALRIYNQPEVGLPGYNPNDEHAVMLPSATGTGMEAVFALRADFGSGLPAEPTAASDPYVLVKYWHVAAAEWAYRVFQVSATSAGFPDFRYTGTAATTVSPPYPLRLLSNCAETLAVGQASADDPPPAPFWMDYKNQLWSKSAGSGSVLYHYPLQPTFFYDLNNDDVADAGDGTCIPWLARLPADLGGTDSPTDPIQVDYEISWPAEIPLLQVGETLLEPKRGLPDILNQAAVEVVYDQLKVAAEEEQNADPTQTLVQIIDPLNPRTVFLPAIPDEVGTETDEVGKTVILGSADGSIKLPYAVRSRVRWDPLTEKLSFQGHYDDSQAGEPLLLLNVMSKRERVLLKTLDGGDGSEATAYDTDCNSLDDECSWNEAVEALFRLSRNPHGITEERCFRIPFGPRICWTLPPSEDDVLIGWQDADQDGDLEPYQAVGVEPALTAGFAQATGLVTVAFNNDPGLTPLPVSLNIIEIGCLQYPEPPEPTEILSTYQGEIKVIESDNIFDEQLTLRHSGDFGGNPDGLEFEWYFHPDEDGTPPSPLPDPEGGQLYGWLQWPVDDPAGAVEITLGGANIRTLSDNWYVTRYKGLPICDNTNTWSLWAGQPGATPLAPRGQLAEGWIKRVLDSLNPFEARVTDFHASATNTFASMLVQLGERYEGDIAMNADADNLNQFGLIEAYQTVMNRATDLSIDSSPPVDYGPANAAILNVASRLTDFYLLLGNEAYSDAQDPTIGISTDSVQYGFGSLAPTIFNFENQVASLLEEELVLLRGRDDSQGPVAATPVYNRLFWNFTGGSGEVAYDLSYNISDQNVDGVIDETDARILFPQGHGDAWGHYLTAIKNYYDLLRHPYYSWDPRPEAVLVAGVPIQVDYLDERTFAAAAAARAKVGAELVDLTYRSAYVEDPAGQWQGYKDTDDQRAWGLSEWARRAGMGAYFDWVVGNAILPDEDPDPDHFGIQKIDRTTVDELDEIISLAADVTARIDGADHGLNPLGLAKGVVPFDIDPSQVDAGKTHFEQVYERAVTAVDNAVSVWDFANQLGRMLRFNQDQIDDLTDNSLDTEIDFNNRLIEIFGYPYDDDIGPAGLYPSGYDGPDLYHYQIIDAPVLAGTDLELTSAAKTRTFTATYEPMDNGANFFDLHENVDDLDCGNNPFGDGCSLGKKPTTGLDVEYTTWQSPGLALSFVADQDWDPSTSRRADGSIQSALNGILRAQIDLGRALQEHDNLIQDIIDKKDELRATYNIRDEQINVKNDERKELNQLTASAEAMKAGAITARRVSAGIDATFDDGKTCIPDNMIAGLAGGGDLFSTVQCATGAVGSALAFGLDTAADGLDIAGSALEASKEDVSLQAAIEVDILDDRLEIFNIKGELDVLVRTEPVSRAEVNAKAEELKQAQSQYKSALAEGQRVLADLIRFRKQGAAAVQDYRYQDMAFRIFRNDALQKYRAAFDLAARYTYLAATAYDYETNLLGTDAEAGQGFLTDIVRERSLGQLLDGAPVPGSPGLADPMGRMEQNFAVLKGQMGFNNPQTETNRFSLRHELYRIGDDVDSDASWRTLLREHRVDDLWAVPEFRRYARPFAPESAGPQPGIVIRFSTTVTFSLNFFGWPLGPGDSAYDPTHFATKVRGVGLWFEDYAALPLSNTPRVYLIPVGADVLRSPAAFEFKTREWAVVDQVLPVPFPIGSADLEDPAWLPEADSLSGTFTEIRRFSSFLAHHFSEPYDSSEIISDSRLIGRSVWNTEWMLIIPGGTLLYDSDDGLDTFIDGQLIPGGGGERDGAGVSDVKIFFQTYAYSGN